jgi:hypothetical protein
MEVRNEDLMSSICNRFGFILVSALTFLFISRYVNKNHTMTVTRVTVIIMVLAYVILLFNIIVYMMALDKTVIKDKETYLAWFLVINFTYGCSLGGFYYLLMYVGIQIRKSSLFIYMAFIFI